MFAILIIAIVEYVIGDNKMIMNINNSNEQMTINTLQQLSQLTSTKISISIYSYKTRDVQQQKSYKCYNTPPSVLTLIEMLWPTNVAT